MKEEKNKTNRPLSEFQRYVRGEMTKRQENAFQRKLQKDPFASEAAEGYSEISADEADEDLEQLGKQLKKRVTGGRRKIYYRIAASIAVLMIISSVYLFIDRNKPAGEISKDYVAPSKSEAVDTRKSAEPAREVTEIIAESQETTADKVKSDALNSPVIAEPVVQETLAFADKKDTSVNVAAGQIAMAEKVDSVVIIAADQAAEPAEPVRDAILAEYRTEAKNARAAGDVPAKAAVMQAGNTPPQPVSGKANFDRYIRENTRRPADLSEGDSVAVAVSFIVRTTGALEDLKIISSSALEASNEAKRLILEGPEWNPAIKNGVVTDDEVRLTIIIK